MDTLYYHCKECEWQAIITHIQSLADGDAADQIFHQGYNGWTEIMYACLLPVPLELVQLMITRAKLDSRKRCLLTITSSNGWTVLHWAAWRHSDPAVPPFLCYPFERPKKSLLILPDSSVCVHHNSTSITLSPKSHATCSLYRWQPD